MVKAFTTAMPCVASCMAPIKRELTSTESRVMRRMRRISLFTV